MPFRISGIARKVATVGGVYLLLASGSPVGATQFFDAVSNFSLASNPNGTWSYGTLSSFTGGTFTPFTVPLVNQDYVGQNAWYNGGAIPNAAVVDRNTSGSTKSYLTIVQPTNVLRLDGENFIADVRWTTPATGVYNLDGFFQRIDTAGVPVSVRVIQGTTTSLFAVDGFSGFNNQVAFTLHNVALTLGTVIDFAQGAPQYNNDSTGLAATITPSSVPEPSSLVLVGLGLTGALLRSCRRSTTSGV